MHDKPILSLDQTEKPVHKITKRRGEKYDVDKIVIKMTAKKEFKKNINTKKETFGFTSVIVNSNRPPDMYNKNIIDGEPIEEIDNSLLEMYKMNSYKFDGFGDYACITNVLPTSGGSISPAGIYYSIDNNFFVGYRGKTPSLSEFQQHIAPAIYKSEYWDEYSNHHHKNCPGCNKIKLIATGKESGKSQALWKGITMSHYIFAVDELLSEK